MLGVGVPWQLEEFHPGAYGRAVDMLQPPAWYTWKSDCLGQPGFTPMVWQAKLGPWFTAQIERAQQWTKTGPFLSDDWTKNVWFLGNEPERAEQSATAPHEFAEAVRTWQALVGGKWAGPGILWGDQGRAWLDTYLRIGGPVPDVWAIHIYGSNTVDGWDAQRVHADQWLYDRTLQPRDVWFTETNGSADIMHYLTENEDIVAFWYSAHDPFGDNRASDLVNEDATALTELGRVYASLHGVGGAGTQQHKRYMPVIRGEQ